MAPKVHRFTDISIPMYRFCTFPYPSSPGFLSPARTRGTHLRYLFLVSCTSAILRPTSDRATFSMESRDDNAAPAPRPESPVPSIIPPPTLLEPARCGSGPPDRWGFHGGRPLQSRSSSLMRCSRRTLRRASSSSPLHISTDDEQHDVLGLYLESGSRRGMAQSEGYTRPLDWNSWGGSSWVSLSSFSPSKTPIGRHGRRPSPSRSTADGPLHGESSPARCLASSWSTSRGPIPREEAVDVPPKLDEASALASNTSGLLRSTHTSWHLSTSEAFCSSTLLC